MTSVDIAAARKAAQPSGNVFQARERLLCDREVDPVTMEGVCREHEDLAALVLRMADEIEQLSRGEKFAREVAGLQPGPGAQDDCG